MPDLPEAAPSLPRRDRLRATAELHRLAGRLLGLALAPGALVAAALAWLTLAWDFGDDPIGYTVLATRPHEAP